MDGNNHFKSPSPETTMFEHSSILPMIVLLLSALTLGIIFVFRKQISKMRRQNKLGEYHNIHSDDIDTSSNQSDRGIALSEVKASLDESEPSKLEVPTSDNEEADDGQLSEKEIEDMI